MNFCCSLYPIINFVLLSVDILYAKAFFAIGGMLEDLGRKIIMNIHTKNVTIAKRYIIYTIFMRLCTKIRRENEKEPTDIVTGAENRLENERKTKRQPHVVVIQRAVYLNEHLS